MRSVRSAHGFSESLCCRPDNVWGGSLPTFQGYCAKASRSRVQVNSDTNAHTKTKEMTRLRLQVLCVGQCLGMYACDWSWVEFLLLVFQTGDTSTRRKSRDKWKKRRKKCEAERTDAPRQRYEEKGSTFLTPNKVVFCVCCAETVHGVLQEERRKGVKGDGIKENTKSKKEWGVCLNWH